MKSIARQTALLLVALFIFSSHAADIAASTQYSKLVAQISDMIRWEMQDKAIPAISIALVDNQQIVWSEGFGNARTNVPANADTIYRVGSVSKLFTDIAIMRLVERRILDLDAPITKYVPSFGPKNPFQKEVTLRQLMAHRSGLCREPPVGNYFDPTEPSLADTIESLTDPEVRRAKAQMEAGVLMSLETAQGRADQMARSIEVFGRILPLDEMLGDLRAVDPASAKAAGAALLDGRTAIASVGARLAAVA